MTTPAKVWLRFFLIGYIVLMVLWIVSLTSPVPYGDLTRIGRLSEREFGWTAPPPQVDPAYLKGTPVDQADVLVIGDSFSMTFRWQSVLTRAGYRVATTNWGQYENALCDKMPFFAEDEDNGPLTPAHLDWMKNFTKAHGKVPIIWMVIPNKTTVYLKPDYSRDFETAFRASGLGPDLYAFTREKHTQIRDFYFPNDTHMSMHGQFALGERMLTAVREVLPAPPSRTP